MVAIQPNLPHSPSEFSAIPLRNRVLKDLSSKLIKLNLVLNHLAYRYGMSIPELDSCRCINSVEIERCIDPDILLSAADELQSKATEIIKKLEGKQLLDPQVHDAVLRLEEIENIILQPGNSSNIKIESKNLDRLRIFNIEQSNVRIAAIFVQKLVFDSIADWTLSNTPKLSFNDSSIQNLLTVVSRRTRNIDLVNKGRTSFLYRTNNAFDVAQITILACDYLIERLASSSSDFPVKLSERGILKVGDKEMPAPEIVAGKLAHFPHDLITAREDALCLASCNTKEIKLVLEIMKSLTVYLELGASTVEGLVQNVVPYHSVLAGIVAATPIISGNLAEPRQRLTHTVTLDGVLRAIHHSQRSWRLDFSGLTISGSLGPAAEGNASHQTPVGENPFRGVQARLSSTNNVAHPEATQIAHLETDLNFNTKRYFGVGWENCIGITTSGGTASNRIASELAKDISGVGLAFKRISKALDLEIKNLEEKSDLEALLLGAEELSELIGSCTPEQLKVLHSNFRVALEQVQKEHPPLIIQAGKDWTHYTLADCIHEMKSIRPVLTPLTNKLEVNLSKLKVQIDEHFTTNGASPVIFPLTFCNTGLGLTGFNPNELLEFDTWLKAKWGVKATYIFDAAQGGITFGVHTFNSVYEAHKVIKKLAFAVTTDPHKYDRPVACSLLSLKYSSLCTFINSLSADHSYIQSGDAATIRGRYLLSSSADALFDANSYLRDVLDGSHSNRFQPIMDSSIKMYNALQSSRIKIRINGRQFRLVPMAQPHSGILGITLIPADENSTYDDAQQACKDLFKLINVKGSNVSCSEYVLQRECLSDDWDSYVSDISRGAVPKSDIERSQNMRCLRLVFRSANQHNILRDILSFSN